MNKRILSVMVIIVLWTQGVYALLPEDIQLLQKDYQQYQLWSLSRNYWFGTTTKLDKVKALAWELLYLQSLPITYPGKAQLEKKYTDNLTAQQIQKARQLAQIYREKYQIANPMTETEMYRVQDLRDDKAAWTALPISRKPSLHKEKTGIVGRVLPWTDIENGNILLRMKTQQPENADNPWSPVIPLTISNAGDFFAIGLSPGTYQLYINTSDLKGYKEITLKEGEIKGLSLIDLKMK